MVPSLLVTDHADRSAVKGGVGGAMLKEGTVKGSSSASVIKEQHELSEVNTRWEEHRSLTTYRDTHQVGTAGSIAVDGTVRTTRATGASRDMSGARGGAVAMNEEFLRSYFTEVSTGFYGW